MSQASRFAMIFTAAVLCAACAPSYTPPITNGLGGTGTNSINTGVTGLTGSTGSTSSISSTSSTSSTSIAATGTEPLIVEQVSGVGYNSTSVTVSAASVLAMTFTPGVQNTNVSGTGFTPQYSELGVYITVNGNSQNTGMLSNGFDGTEAQASPVLNFSSSLSGSTESVTITISQPNNNYFCLNFGYYCSWTQVYQGQPWNGTLQIQTDSTVAVTSGSSFY